MSWGDIGILVLYVAWTLLGMIVASGPSGDTAVKKRNETDEP
jgi:hypothetical protein